MARSILCFAFLAFLFSFKMNGDSALIQGEMRNRMNKVESELKEAKMQVDILDKANDKILQVTYFTVGSMFALIVGLAIWNSLVNYKINTAKIHEATERIKSEQQVYIKEYLEKNIDSKVDSKLSGLDSQYKLLRQDMLSQKIDLKKMQVVSTDLSPGANLETWTLVELLDLTYTKFKNEFAPSEHGVIEALRALVSYTTEHKSLPDYETDRILGIMVKIDEPEFSRYVNQIRQNIEGVK